MTQLAPGPIIDSHLHVWQLGTSRYEWIRPELGFLYADFTAEQAREQLAGAGVEQAILVQIEDSAVDTEYMFAVAGAHDWIRGVVGWVDLENSRYVREYLEHWAELRAADGERRRDDREASLSAATKLVGFRHLIHDDPRSGFLGIPEVRKSLALIGRAGLTFDVPDAWPKCLAEVAEVARATPELQIVIDHFGKPPLAPAEREQWLRYISAAAGATNVATKVSGLLGAAEKYSAAELAGLFDQMLQLFGPERILFGGDWPVSTLDGSYQPTVEVLFELIGTLSPHEQRAILHDNAERVYRLPGANSGSPRAQAPAPAPTPISPHTPTPQEP